MCGSRDPYILNLGGEQSTSPLLQGTEPLAQIGQECELTPESGQQAVENIKIICSCLELDSDSSVIKPTA